MIEPEYDTDDMVRIGLWDENKKLRVEVERLRAALRDIEMRGRFGREASEIARAALEEGK